MDNYQSYGGGDAGFGGGGGFAQGGFTSPTSGSQGGKTGRSQTTVTPLSVFQIQNGTSAEDSILVDNHELNQVVIVGVIRQVETKNTKNTYTVEDHTGVIEVVHWIDGAEDDENAARKRAECREGMYVRAIGTVKTFNDKRSITAFLVKPITDFNEITHHLLNVLQVHLYMTKGKIGDDANGGAAAAAAAHAGAAPMAVDNSFGGQFASTGMDTNNDTVDGFSAEQSAIIKVLQACSSEAGLSIDELCGQLGKTFGEQKIRAAINQLNDDGVLYSTVDDDHFKTTLS